MFNIAPLLDKFTPEALYNIDYNEFNTGTHWELIGKYRYAIE